jgi:hypothetical protein
MQTFLPYPELTRSIICLDNKRLGKQRIEAKQIYDTLTGKSDGWKNHPAVRMWRGYEKCLAVYHNLCISTWIIKGYTNNMPYIVLDSPKVSFPPWIGSPEFHSSHRSNLLRKDPIFYRQYEWTEPDNLPYVWPV